MENFTTEEMEMLVEGIKADKAFIEQQQAEIGALKQSAWADKAEISKLVSHIREGFEDGDEKSQKEYEAKSIEILHDYYKAQEG